MSFAINKNSINSGSLLRGGPSIITPSDTTPHLVRGCYPRGFQVLTGGTLTVWVEDDDNHGYTKKLDLGTVPDSYEWSWGGIFGVAATTSAGANITATNIVAIP